MIRDDTPRESVARALASYYRELQKPQREKPFSLSRFFDWRLDGPGLNGEDAYEREACEAHAIARGMEFDPLRPTLPLGALVRTLSDSLGASGDYLTAPGAGGELSLMLQGFSVVNDAGVRMLDAQGTGEQIIAAHKTAASGTWIGPGGSATASSAPLGQFSLTPHTHISLIDYSEQFARQGRTVADRLLATALLQTAGTAIDSATISGAGGAEPLGIINRSDITAQSGTALSWAGVCAMRKTVLNNGAREFALRWLAAPDVQEVLSKREKTTALGTIWDDGFIGGIPAVATSRVPNGHLILADWSQLYVAMWNGGLTVEVNKHYNFDTGTRAARILAMLDVGFAQAGAVTYAKSVT